MPSSGIPDEVRALLAEYIETYEQLEILLLVSEQADRSWDAAAIASALSIPGSVAAGALQELAEKGLITATRNQAGELAVYASTHAGQMRTINALARAYRENRLEVVRMVTSNAIDRIRNAAIRTFADAFVLGRKK